MLLQAIRALCDQWHPSRDRVLWAPILFGAGIALYFALPFEPDWRTVAGALAATAALAWRLRGYVGLSFAALALFLFTGGFFAGTLRTHLADSPQIVRETGVTRIEGRVLDITVTDDDADTGKRRVTMGELAIEKLAPEATPKTIRLTTHHIPADVRPGERIAFLAKLVPPSGPVIAGGFDYRRQAYFEGVGAVGFTLGKFERLAPADTHADVWFSTLRQTISKHITTSMKHPESAVATALLAGERAAIPERINDSLRDSGLYHLLSISGLHVAIVCGVTFFALRFIMALWPWLALHHPIKKYAAAAALLVGICYMLLAGAPVPTQRAMMTSGLVLVAVMLDRAALSMRTLAVVALVLLALRPEALVGPSFQLSFAAVLSMVAFHEGIGRRWMAEHRDMNAIVRASAYVGGIVLTTMLVSFATFPIVLHHFGRVQIYGVLANALAIPLTSFVVMPAGMAALLLMPFGLDAPFLKVVEWGIAWTVRISDFVAGLPYAVSAFPSLPLVPFLVCVFGFLLLMLWRGSFRWAGLALMAAAITWGAFAPRAFVLIDEAGKTVAVKGGDQVVYLFKKPTGYVRSNWMGYLGGAEVAKPLKYGDRMVGDVRVFCDDFACRILKDGFNLSILRSAYVLNEECAWADSIVATDRAVHADACPAMAVDTRSLYMGNGGAVWIEKPHFRPTVDTSEKRPWSMRR